MPEPVVRRAPLPRAILLILAGYLVLAAAYSVIVPLGEAPDEVSHYAYVRSLARDHALPTPQGMAFGETFQPPLYYLIAALTNFWVGEGAFVPQANADFDVEDPAAAPNLLLHPRQEDFPYHDGALAWHLIRLYSVLLGAGTILATYKLARLLFPSQPPLSWASAGFVAFLPEFLFLNGAINNDNLSTLLSALLLLQLCRILMNSTRNRDYIVLGFLLGFGVLTKTSLWTFVPVSGGVLIWKMRKKGFAPLFLSGGAALFIASPWVVHNALVLGDPLGWSLTRAVTDPRTAPLSLDDYMGLATGLYVSFWGAFGGAGHLLLPDGMLYLLFLPTSLAVGGIGKVVWQHRRTAKRFPKTYGPYFVLVTHLAIVMVAFLFWSRSVLGTGQGRLLFPALPTIAIFFMRGLVEWTPNARNRKPVARILPALMFLFGVAVLWLQIRPTYTRPARDAGMVIPPQSVVTDFRFGDHLHLAGYVWPATVDDRISPGTTLTLTLVWQADTDVRQDVRLTLKLVDRHGLPVWIKDGSPSAGWDTTDRWRRGDTIVARHKITLPHDTPPGWTRLLAGMHPAGRNTWLPIRNMEGKFLGDTIMIGQMTVAHRSRACAKSAIRSSVASIPTETRIKPSAMPSLCLSAGERPAWDVVAGRVISVSTPPRLGAEIGNLVFCMNRSAVAMPPCNSKLNIPL